MKRKWLTNTQCVSIMKIYRSTQCVYGGISMMENEYVYEVEGLQIPIDIESTNRNEDRGKILQAYQLKAVRELSGMNRKDFAEWLGIPYRTISDWEHSERKMPDYVLRLIAYKVRMEFVEKRGD